MQNGRRRFLKDRTAGINEAAPYWRGERAEDIVQQRVVANAAEKEAKRIARSASRATKATVDPALVKSLRSSRHAEASGSSSRELRRLERALPRRKTLAARQRLEQRIKQLRQELGA